MRKSITGAIAASILSICIAAALAQTAPAKSADTSKGKALVDAKGLTLYTFDRDASRQIELQRPMRHQLAAAAGRRRCQGIGRLDHRHPRRRRQAMGLQGQAAL